VGRAAYPGNASFLTPASHHFLNPVFIQGHPITGEKQQLAFRVFRLRPVSADVMPQGFLTLFHMGTILSLFPLPVTLINPSSNLKSSIVIPVSSDTLSAVSSSVRMMVWSRQPWGADKSIVPRSFSI